jgi:DDB1- and CUL4-associated factor 11
VQVLEQDRGEEGEVDDSVEAIRRMRMLSLTREDLNASGHNARARRQFVITPLRNAIATRGGSTA